MDLKELENKVLDLEKKYSKKPNQVIDYYNELVDVFNEYSDLNNNMDYEYDEIFDDIVSGEDTMDEVMWAEPNKIYHWTEENGRTVVYEIDYNYLADLARQALKCYEKTKETEFDIC